MVVYEGTIANYNTWAQLGQIEIDDTSGLITRVAYNLNKITNEPDRVFGEGAIIFPGMGDIHIHAREDNTGKQIYKEEYRTAAAAALNGGVVHVSAMPNTPNPVTTKENFTWHRNRVADINHPVSILNYVGIGPGDRPIGEPGEHFYKAFFGKSVGNLTFYDEHELEETLRHYHGHHVSFHVEYEPFIEASRDGKTHSERRPIGAVNHGLKLLLPMIERHNIHAKLCHWSTGGDSFDMIREHREKMKKANGPYTTIEVSPLHLMFDTSMTDKDPSLWLKIQMNPAIQGPEHRRQLIDGLRSGFIDYIATDHAPHTEEEKCSAFARMQEDFPHEKTNVALADRTAREKHYDFKRICCEDGMSGAPWLDTYAPVVTWLMMNENFITQEIARVTAYNPGKFVNPFLKHQFADSDIDFGKGFGKIEEGYVGSLTVINTQKGIEITRDMLKTKVGWSPLEGKEFPGSLESVIIRGKAYDSQGILQDA